MDWLSPRRKWPGAIITGRGWTNAIMPRPSNGLCCRKNRDVMRPAIFSKALGKTSITEFPPQIWPKANGGRRNSNREGSEWAFGFFDQFTSRSQENKKTELPK